MITINPTNREWFLSNKCMNFSYMQALSSRRIVFIAGNRFYYQDTLGE